MTGVLPDPGVDPAGWVLLQCDLVEADVAEFDSLAGRAGPSPWLSTFVRAQVALWRAVANLPHASRCYSAGQVTRECDCPTGPTLDHAVAAARAYQDGTGT